MLGGLVVSLAALVCLGPQLCKGFAERIGIGGFIALGRHLSDDGGADIYPGKKGVFLDVRHGPPDQEQGGGKAPDGPKQLGDGHPPLHLGQHLRRNIQLHHIQKHFQSGRQQAEQQRAFSAAPGGFDHPAHILKDTVFGSFVFIHFSSPREHTLSQKFVPGAFWGRTVLLGG